MKNIWKWVLGILLVLVILAIPFALHYAFGNRFGFVTRFDGIHAPMMGNDRVWGHQMPHEFGGMRGGPLRGGRNFSFFGPLAFIGGLVKLAVFGAMLYGAYWLGKRNARLVVEPSTSSPAPAPEAMPEAAPKRARKVSGSE